MKHQTPTSEPTKEPTKEPRHRIIYRSPLYAAELKRWKQQKFTMSLYTFLLPFMLWFALTAPTGPSDPFGACEEPNEPIPAAPTPDSTKVDGVVPTIIIGG